MLLTSLVLEKEKKIEIEEGELTEEKLNGTFHSIGLVRNEEQLKAFSKQLAESAARKRKCGQHCSGSGTMAGVSFI